MDRGLNEAFAPTREQQQQQTKSQKQQQQQKNTINLKAINKENNKPTSRFFFYLGKTTDHRQSTGQIQGTAFMVQSSTLNHLQFVRIKAVSTTENDTMIQ